MPNVPTPTLRLTQTGSQNDTHTIQLEWLGDGPRQVASAIVDLALTEQDQQDIRWYVEEYAEYPFDPYPARAARVEVRMRELGHELFRKLFGANTRTLPRVDPLLRGSRRSLQRGDDPRERRDRLRGRGAARRRAAVRAGGAA